VLLAHAVVLVNWTGPLVEQALPAAPQPVPFAFREIVASSPALAAAAGRGAEQDDTARISHRLPAARREATAARGTMASQGPRASAARALPEAAIAAKPPAAPATASAADAAPSESVADAPIEAAAPAALPTYRTQPPPAATLHYDVRRGSARGEASLSWRIGDDGQYLMELRGAGASDSPALAPHWTSRGALDAAGLAPERFAVSRRGRERHAANFQREAGVVSFAGPSRRWPLAPGTQDRLSWMVQLAAVLQAEPALATPGAQISMLVVGAHGDAGIWTFVVQGEETIAGPEGQPVVAWRLHREGGATHDPHVQVWLVPSLHHVPARIVLTLPRHGESTEFRLRALQAP
jgi:hypothetical protein